MEDARNHYRIFIGTTGRCGMTMHTISLARALASGGYPVTLTAFQSDYFSEFLADTSVTVEHFPFAEKEGQAGLKLREWLRQIRKIPDSYGILCRGVGGASSLPFLAGLARRCGRLYTIEHGMADMPYVAWGKPIPTKTLKKRIINWLACKQVYRAIAVSEATRQSVISVYDFQPSKIITAHNWIDIERFKPDEEARAQFRRSLGLSEESFLIGYVGRLAKEKRVDLLLEGFAQFAKTTNRKVKLAILGVGPVRQDLERLRKQLGVEDQVELVGWVRDTSSWHRAFDLAVVASYAEAFGLGIMESMASGTICLATSGGGTGEFIRNGVNGFVGPLDKKEDIAAWFNQIASLDLQEKNNLKINARNTVVEEFSPRVTQSALLDALDAKLAAERVRNGGNI